MQGHHLVMGKLKDYLTGEILEDTHDERYRQKIASFLVEQKGYPKDEILPRQPLIVSADEKRARIAIDLVLTIDGKKGMIIKYGPGSLTTRQRPALAAARLLAPYQIPYAVVTNGESAEIMDVGTGKVIGKGMEDIPERSKLLQWIEKASFEPVEKKRIILESRVLFCYEIDGACPCDTTICRLGESDESTPN